MLTAMPFVCNQQKTKSGFSKKQRLPGQLLPMGSGRCPCLGCSAGSRHAELRGAVRAVVGRALQAFLEQDPLLSPDAELSLDRCFFV